MQRMTACLFVLGTFVTAASAADDAQPKAFPAGRQFFEEYVVPKLAANGCPMCHSIGYVQPNVVVYTDLLPFLAMGDAPETTPVIRKIANLRAIRPDLPTHPGGQRCETIHSEPCSTIIKWWGIEFGGKSARNGAVK